MKNQVILLTMLVMLLSITYVHAEVNVWSSVVEDTNRSTVTYWATYNLYDTSASGVGKHKEVPIVIRWQHNDLPYNISATLPQYANAYVDWCNLSIYHYKNDFDSLGNIVNSSFTETNQFFNNTVADDGTYQFNLVDLDTMSSFMTCHYTNPQTLYIDGVLFGLTTTYLPAFQCRGCEQFSYEELTKENEKTSESITQELEIYETIFKVVRYNYKFWLFAKWFVNIAILVASLFLVFAGAYYVYAYFKKLEKLSR